jgi:hypothetical protein
MSKSAGLPSGPAVLTRNDPSCLEKVVVTPCRVSEA